MKTKTPYLAYAFFCERVLHEQDGVLSAIRIVDRVHVNYVRKDKSKPPPKTFSLFTTALIGLKSGDFRGKGKMRIEGTSPSGKPLKFQSQDLEIELTGGDNGCNLILQSKLELEEQGLYWFDVYFNRTLLTRMPLSAYVLERESPKPSTPSMRSKKKAKR